MAKDPPIESPILSAFFDLQLCGAFTKPQRQWHLYGNFEIQDGPNLDARLTFIWEQSCVYPVKLLMPFCSDLLSTRVENVVVIIGWTNIFPILPSHLALSIKLLKCLPLLLYGLEVCPHKCIGLACTGVCCNQIYCETILYGCNG